MTLVIAAIAPVAGAVQPCLPVPFPLGVWATMRFLIAMVGMAATAAASPAAHAQTPAEFYKGKTITLDIPTSVGSGYDIQSRLLARHMPKRLPGNPTIVPRNVEGAGGLRVANLLYNTAPKDGTAFAVFFRSTPFEPMFGNKAAQFDATRFSWIGSPSSEVRSAWRGTQAACGRSTTFRPPSCWSVRPAPPRTPANMPRSSTACSAPA